MLKVTNLHI